MRPTVSNRVQKVLIILLSIAAIPSGAQVPDRIEVPIPNRNEPMWQSATAVSTGEGEVDWSRFSANSAQTLQELAAENRELAMRSGRGVPNSEDVLCEHVFGTPITESLVPKPNRTLHDLVVHSEAMLRGRIVTVEPGFIDGLPSSLLRVEIDEELRTLSGVGSEGHVYVAFPFARFRIGETSFCTGIEAAYQPKVGDGIFVFLYERPLDNEGVLLLPEPEEMFFEVDGQLVLPHLSAMGSAARTARDLADLAARVRVARLAVPSR